MLHLDGQIERLTMALQDLEQGYDRLISEVMQLRRATAATKPMTGGGDSTEAHPEHDQDK